MAKAQGLVTDREVMAEWLRMGYTNLIDVQTGEILANIR